MEEIKLTKQDWKEMLVTTQALVKTSMAQLVIYKNQIQKIEEIIKEFEEKELIGETKDLNSS